ncbi:MAG: hypothetical protein K2Y39_05990, partial [Candidatus Obscuribacterales bacterium]|nr:hypothetical protein [Candidatus Obscuribacterales bacterium]
MKDFLKRHKLLTLVIKSIVFLALLGVLCTYAVTSYLASKSTSIATLDRNSASAASASIQSEIPVFIEICRPVCAQQLPAVEAAAREFAGRVVFYQLDPESEPDLTASVLQIVGQSVNSFPAHIVIAKAPRATTGMKTGSQLVDFISQATGLQAAPSSTALSGATATPSAPSVTYQNITVVDEQSIRTELA